MVRRIRANRSDTPTPEPLDEELLALRALSDPAAFEPLFTKYFPIVRALCFDWLGNEAAAEDVTAEVFRKAWANLHTFHGGSFFKWIYTIARNTLRDLADRPPPPIELFDAFHDPTPGPEELALRAVTDAEVRAAILRLPEPERTVVELRRQGFKNPEIATVLGRDAAWVAQAYFRVLKRLAGDLRGEWEQEERHG